ncbi:T9SS type A sorting domain-containing protein [Spirosoma arcticum]
MRYIALLIYLLINAPVHAQTPFSATWPFDGSPGGSPSQPNVGTGGADFTGVRPSNLPGADYVTGQNGQAVNVINWSQSPSCNFSEYVQVSVNAQNGQRITLTQFSVFVSRSSPGPQELRVRSSVDNYGSDLTVTSVSTSFQSVSFGLSGAGFTDQTGTIIFRLYGCNGTGGSLRLDDLIINGTVTTVPLPVTLLSFTAKPEGDRVQLAWATTSERDADRFVVERSADLREYVSVGEVTAKGTTDTRQYYGLTDTNPLPGANYYRLRQIDRDGTAHSFKPVSAVIEIDGVVAVVYPNPADPARIYLRLWNADDATVRLLSLVGQVISGKLERESGKAEWIPTNALPTGMYLLEVQTNGQKLVSKVLVR